MYSNLATLIIKRILSQSLLQEQNIAGNRSYIFTNMLMAAVISIINEVTRRKTS